MVTVTRRHLLGACAALVTAGCGAPEATSPTTRTPGGTPAETATTPSDVDGDGRPDDSYQSRRQFISDRRSLPEDTWHAYDIEFWQAGLLGYAFTVPAGPAIDVLVIEASDYEAFVQSEDVPYLREVSVLDSTGSTVRGTLSAGSYKLVIDNSPRGEAAPPSNFRDDVATVAITIEAAE